MERNENPNCLVTNILQYIFLFVPQKKETHKSLEQYNGKYIFSKF